MGWPRSFLLPALSLSARLLQHPVADRDNLPLYSGAPFNMEPPAYLAWYYEGDGKKLLEEIYAERNIHPMLCSIIGPEGAGWFAQPIEGMDDFDGLKIRFAGIGG